MKKKVVFLCATNGVQSLMAEALLNRFAPESFDVTSAGIILDSERPHSLTIQVMEESGFDLRQKNCRKAADLQDQTFDFVITIGERTRFGAPGLVASETVHWEFEDPTQFSDPDRQLRAFRMTRDQIAQRINLFVLVQVRPVRPRESAIAVAQGGGRRQQFAH